MLVVSNSQSSIIYNLVFFVLSEAHLHFIKCFPAAHYPTARSLAYNSITISPYLTHLGSSLSTGVTEYQCITIFACHLGQKMFFHTRFWEGAFTIQLVMKIFTLSTNCTFSFRNTTHLPLKWAYNYLVYRVAYECISLYLTYRGS